jgi:hypothetical protein
MRYRSYSKKWASTRLAGNKMNVTRVTWKKNFLQNPWTPRPSSNLCKMMKHHVPAFMKLARNFAFTRVSVAYMTSRTQEPLRFDWGKKMLSISSKTKARNHQSSVATKQTIIMYCVTQDHGRLPLSGRESFSEISQGACGCDIQHSGPYTCIHVCVQDNILALLYDCLAI